MFFHCKFTENKHSDFIFFPNFKIKRITNDFSILQVPCRTSKIVRKLAFEPARVFACCVFCVCLRVCVCLCVCLLTDCCCCFFFSVELFCFIFIFISHFIVISGRSTCKGKCKERIAQGQLRFGSEGKSQWGLIFYWVSALSNISSFFFSV